MSPNPAFEPTEQLLVEVAPLASDDSQQNQSLTTTLKDLPVEVLDIVCGLFSDDDDLSKLALIHSRFRKSAQRLLGQKVIVREEQGGRIHIFRRGNGKTPVTDLTVISSILRSHLCACDTCHPDAGYPGRIDNTQLSDVINSLGDTIRTRLFDYRLHTERYTDPMQPYSNSVRHCEKLSQLTEDGSILVERQTAGFVRHYTVYDSTNPHAQTEVSSAATSGNSKSILVGRCNPIDSLMAGEVMFRYIADLLIEGLSVEGENGVSVTVIDPLRLYFLEEGLTGKEREEAEEKAKKAIVTMLSESYSQLALCRHPSGSQDGRTIQKYIEDNIQFSTLEDFSEHSSASRLLDHLKAYPVLSTMATRIEDNATEFNGRRTE